MAVRDKNYNWTPEADALDQELRQKLHPILVKAIENGLTVEDVFYIVADNTQDWLLSFVLLEKNKICKNCREGT
jgi:hypothetical protein